MSIQSRIDQLKQNVSAAFTAIGNKGGTVPSSKVSGNLATAINSIPEGVELNFEVVGGTSQPSNPKENTIWVNTNTAITDWVFSATQPTAATGRVWIYNGTFSTAEFNALKKNGIQVYPLSAKQYVSGAWVDKTAKSYQSGEWVGWWNGVLYDNGNEYTDITGGWATWTPSTGSEETKTEEYFGITAINVYASAGTINSVDVTAYSTLKAIIYSANTKQSEYDKFFISRTKDNGNEHSSQIELAYTVIPNGNSEIEIDISKITGYVYVGICDYSAKLKAIKKCWLE